MTEQDEDQNKLVPRFSHEIETTSSSLTPAPTNKHRKRVVSSSLNIRTLDTREQSSTRKFVPSQKPDQADHKITEGFERIDSSTYLQEEQTPAYPQTAFGLERKYQDRSAQKQMSIIKIYNSNMIIKAANKELDRLSKPKEHRLPSVYETAVPKIGKIISQRTDRTRLNLKSNPAESTGRDFVLERKKPAKSTGRLPSNPAVFSQRKVPYNDLKNMNFQIPLKPDRPLLPLQGMNSKQFDFNRWLEVDVMLLTELENNKHDLDLYLLKLQKEEKIRSYFAKRKWAHFSDEPVPLD